MLWVLSTGSSSSNAHLDPLQPVSGVTDSKVLLGQCRLWNASTGASYRLVAEEGACWNVAMVYNSQNIWANVQKARRPCSMSWNLLEARCVSCPPPPASPTSLCQAVVKLQFPPLKPERLWGT
jgi:hypothetical protein